MINIKIFQNNALTGDIQETSHREDAYFHRWLFCRSVERSLTFFERADCNVDVVVVQNQNETIHKNLAIIPKMASPRPTAPT